MKKLLLMIVAMFIAIAVSAQTNKKVIYLKNGTVVRGVVIEQVPGQSIKVRTADGSIFMYTMAEIKSIERDEIIDEKTIKKRSGISKGWHGFVDIYGSYIEYDDYSDRIVGGTLTYGYNLSRYFYLGLGAGYMQDFEFDFTMVPVYANIRAFFTKNNYTPYISAKVGANVQDDPTMYLDGAIGVRFKIKNKLGLGVAFNYFTSEVYDHEFDNGNLRVNSFGLSLSFDF